MEASDLVLIREAVGHVEQLKELAHYHMASDKRYIALLEINKAIEKLQRFLASRGEHHAPHDLRRDGE